METNYQKQADDFMAKVGATMKAEFLGNMPYFDDDENSRDVYKITLARNKKAYSFRFGQSIASSGETFKRNPRGKTVYDHEPIRWKRIVPSTYDILAVVQKYDVGTFEAFCNDFGYDTDSRKAEKTYFAVQAEYTGIKNLFGDVMEELQEIS